MHASSFENMKTCYRRFVEGSAIESRPEIVVLDIGGANVNGSYRDIFDKPQFIYLGADIAPGDGVSIVLEDPYRLPLDDGSIDIVLSGQMFEHCDFFWLAFAEMVRVVKPDGFIFLIAPSAGPIHRYPVDCYRFYPDAYSALAKYANCQLVDVWLDDRGPWKDLVGVFRRHSLPKSTARAITPATVYDPLSDNPGSVEEESVRGETPYLDVLAAIHHSLAPSLYLEIGVRHGKSLALAQGPAVGVDPKPDVQVALPSTTKLASMTSDDFFAGPHGQLLPSSPDLIFIDGMHLFENALRDFMHVERLAGPGALVVLDDVFPNHPAQAARSRRTRVWTGDIWKIYLCLRERRPDLFILPIDAAPTGLLLVGGLDRNNCVLWDHYNPIVRENTLGNAAIPAEIFERTGARRGDAPIISQICSVLRQARGGKYPPALLADLLRATQSGGRSISPA